jgi:uncharacterized protein (TIGR00299 family) protein
MRVLYIDPVSGISGDMMIAALLDLGVPVSILNETLERLPFRLPRIRAEKVRAGIIEGTRIRFEGESTSLGPQEMRQAICSLGEENVRKDALSMLDILLDCEAAIHGERDVHLHELSDTLIDLVAVAKAMSYLSIDEVYSGPVPFGSGIIKISHGELPNPPPLTIRILTGFPVYFTGLPFELVTPTGATILRHYVNLKECPPFVIESQGIGFGNYEMERPDILRIFMGHRGPSEEIFVVETDIDDMQMEYVGAVVERIRKVGPKEVVYFPVLMKKGRIGVRISVLCDEESLDRVVDLLLSETTTFGVRMRRENRRTLRREIRTLDTPYGTIRVKVGYDQKGRMVKRHVEFDDVKELAEQEGLPFSKLLDEIRSKVDALS